MAYIERPELRIKGGKTWQDEERRFYGHFATCDLHHETSIDSGEFDKELDLTPRANVDGWSMSGAEYSFDIGTKQGRIGDGWVGLGGRNGAHWLYFQPAGFGFLHWPLRLFSQTSLPPLDRQGASTLVRSKVIGPKGLEIDYPVETTLTWPAMGFEWVLSGKRVKESFTIPSLPTPPITPPLETWFGGLFRLDPNDIPAFYDARGLPIEKGSDVEGLLELRDAFNRTLGWLPPGVVKSVPYDKSHLDHTHLAPDVVGLRQRLWQDTLGGFWVFVGARWDELARMRPGPLTFDPTFEITNTNSDMCSFGTDRQIAGGLPFGYFVGRDTDPYDAGLRWTTTTPQGATITTCNIVLVRQSTDFSATFDGDWFGFDVDALGVFSAGTGRASDFAARTTATVTDDDWANATPHTSPSLVTIAQEIVDRAGWPSSGVMGFTWRHDGTADDGWFHWTDESDSAANSADLTVEWTVTAFPPVPGAIHRLRSWTGLRM